MLLLGLLFLVIAILTRIYFYIVYSSPKDAYLWWNIPLDIIFSIILIIIEVFM